MSLKKIVKKNKKISDFAKSYFFRLSDTEFIQKRIPVGWGPSGNT